MARTKHPYEPDPDDYKDEEGGLPRYLKAEREFDKWFKDKYGSDPDEYWDE
jgi:hypothetical protein